MIMLCFIRPDRHNSFNFFIPPLFPVFLSRFTTLQFSRWIRRLLDINIHANHEIAH